MTVILSKKQVESLKMYIDTIRPKFKDKPTTIDQGIEIAMGTLEINNSNVSEFKQYLNTLSKERKTMKNENTIKTKVVLHSPYVTMERNGDCIDLNFCGLDRVFREGEGMCCNHGFKVECDMKDDVLRYTKGSIFRVKLGFSMEMPKGKRANVYQRSGTRKNFGVLLTNHNFNEYNSEYCAEFYAIEDGEMKLGDVILQFEIVDVMPTIEFIFE